MFSLAAGLISFWAETNWRFFIRVWRCHGDFFFLIHRFLCLFLVWLCEGWLYSFIKRWIVCLLIACIHVVLFLSEFISSVWLIRARRWFIFDWGAVSFFITLVHGCIVL
jgi:hypothetical protein